MACCRTWCGYTVEDCEEAGGKKRVQGDPRGPGGPPPPGVRVVWEGVKGGGGGGRGEGPPPRTWGSAPHGDQDCEEAGAGSMAGGGGGVGRAGIPAGAAQGISATENSGRQSADRGEGAIGAPSFLRQADVGQWNELLRDIRLS